MRDYRVDTAKMVNRLLPHYLGGRRLVLFLQSLLKPLDSLNLSWKDEADKFRHEAAMTSQVILLENFLTKKFNKYFKDKTKSVYFFEGSVKGTPLYWEDAGIVNDEFVLRQESESKETASLQWEDGLMGDGEVSFVVCCPAIDTLLVSEEEITAMLTYYLNRYVIAGKKFKITYTE